MPSSDTVLPDQTSLLPRQKLLVVFPTLAAAYFVAYTDQNGIGVALPTIARSLNAANTISWAGTSSLLANTVFQVLYGRLSDIFGRKKVYLSAVALLGVAQLLCATAQDAASLYVFRGLAGIGTGGINSLTTTIVSDVVTLQQRGYYQGILGACLGMGNLVGPFLSAAFSQHATWRGFFYLLAPCSAACCVLAAFKLPSTMPKGDPIARAKLVDYWGLLTGSVATIFFLIPLSGGGTYFAWGSAMVISMFAISGAAFVAFLLVEWKIAKLPMIPLTIFNMPPVSAILAQNFLFGFCYYSELYYLPIYFQNVRLWTPILSAALIVPLVVSQSIFSVTSGFYISKFGRYGEVLWFGYLIWTLGASLLCTLQRTSSPGLIVLFTLFIGTGVGCVFQPCLVAIQAHSPRSLRAVVISNRNLFRALGGAVGLASSSLVLQTALRNLLPPELGWVAESVYDLPDLSTFGAGEREVVLGAYMGACRYVFAMLAPVMGLCVGLNFLVKDKGLTTRE